MDIDSITKAINSAASFEELVAMLQSLDGPLLQSYTEKDLQERDRLSADAFQRELKARIDENEKARSDAHLDFFSLSGSDSESDIGASYGQNDFLAELTKTLQPEGKEMEVRTAKGTRVATQFTLIEASDLIASHTADGKVNPEFPQELQPRDRSRKTSQAWIKKTAADLDPGLLGKTKKADSGAPIVGRDKIVESGNGRALAILEAYKMGSAEEYREFIIEDADSFGVDPERARKMKAPVLVRVRTDDSIDRKAFTIEANQDDKLAMTATEKAKSDSMYLTPQLLALFEPGQDGDMMVASNRDFIRGFLAQLGDAEAAQYTTSTGEPTGGLIARIQAAIFAKAYDDERLLELMADTAKPENRNMINALAAAAPDFIQAKAVNEGRTKATTSQISEAVEMTIDEDTVKALIEASNIVRAAKDNDQRVDEYVSQLGLFGDTDPAVTAMAMFIADNNRSAKRMAMAFKAMAIYIREELERAETADIFGDPVPVDLNSVLAAANSRLEKEYGDSGALPKIALQPDIDLRGGLFESVLDDQAHEAATSPKNNLPEPTQAQYESGNYKKAHVSLHGLNIAIENPKGSTRSGEDPDGNKWSVKMTDHYGYVKGTKGRDGDEIDVYIGPNQNSNQVFVIDQIDQRDGSFDEHKCMLGYKSLEAAVKAYKGNFEEGWKVGPVTQASVSQFKEWLTKGNTKNTFRKYAKRLKSQLVAESIREKAKAGFLQ